MARVEEDAFRAGARRQAAIAELGRRALTGRELPAVMGETLPLIARTLGVEHVGVLELARDEALLVAGVGWKDGAVGGARLDGSTGSQVNYVLRAGAPVVVEDLCNETRFRPSPLLLEHGAVSGVSVVIPDHSGAFGILGAYTRGRRTFSIAEAYFLQAAATVLAQAIERARAEKALRRSREELERLLDTTSDIIAIEGPDGLVRYVSPSVERMLGYTAQEFAGRSVLDFVHPEDVSSVLRFYREVARTPGVSPPIEFRARHKDGSWRVLESICNNLIGDPMIGGIVVSSRDVTARRRAEEKVVHAQAARAEAEKVADMIRGVQSVTDIALAHLSLDELLRELLVRIEEVLGADLAVIMLADPHGETFVARAARDHGEAVGVRIAAGEGYAGRIAAERCPLIIPDVDEADIVNPLLRSQGIRSLLGVPLLFEGLFVGLIEVGTRRPRSFTEDDARLLRLAADRIGFAIDRARLFEAERSARAEAEVASRTKDEFLATLSHELRTPLTPILTWAQFIRTRTPDADTVARGLRSIERSTKLQLRLIEDLLDVSRSVAGTLRLEVRPVKLSALIAASLEAARPSADAKAIRLDASLDPEAGPASGDASRLQQVMWNLLSNAIKFTPRGGAVAVRLARGDGHAVITVTDSGKGIAPDFLPYAFDRFRQADSSSTRAHGGLGLGLAIVRHLVELHGGTVEAASAGEGEGATFTVRLPLAAGETEARAADLSPAATGPAATAGLAGVHVLLVDDDADTLDSLAAVLEGSGARVTAAASADEALQALARETPDVLVSDIAMPAADGHALIRTVRTLDAARGRMIPAAALSAYARDEDQARALEAGFDVHVSKPVEPAALVAVVARLAGRAPAPVTVP